MPNINFFQGDCMGMLRKNVLKYNVVFADHPYGIAYQSAKRIDKQLWKPKIKNDESPYVEWIKPAFDSLCDGGRMICFYRWDVQDEFVYWLELAGFDIKSQIVWDKVVHGMGDLKGEHAPQHELAFFCTKGRYEFKGRRPKTVYTVQRVNGDKMIHPNEKPVKLVTQILRDISIPSDYVCDPFGGSFVTAYACWSLGNSLDTSELDPYYFRIAKERFDRKNGQLTPILDKTDYTTLNTGLFSQV